MTRHAHGLLQEKKSLALYRSYPTALCVTRALACLMAAYAALERWPLAVQLAGFLAARDGGTGRIKEDVGSLAAIAEYEAAITEIHQRLQRHRLNAEWDRRERLDDEAAIDLALDETRDFT